MIVLKQTAGFISGLQGALKAQAGYLQSLETEDAFSAESKPQEEPSNGESHESQRDNRAPQQKSSTSLEAQKLRTAIGALGELHSKLGGELAFAKREIAYGNLDAEDLKELFKLCHSVFTPITGMSSIAYIFDRGDEKRGCGSMSSMSSEFQNVFQGKNSNEKTEEKEKTRWNDILKTMHGSFETMTEALDEGLQHALYTLQLTKPKKENEVRKIQVADQTTQDVEGRGDSIRPGDTGFATYLTRKIDNFYDQRKLTLTVWCRQRGVSPDENLFKNPVIPAPRIHIENEDLWQHHRSQRQLYLILYVSVPYARSLTSPLP